MAVLPSNSIKNTALYWVSSVEQKCSTIDLTKDFAACMQILAGWLTNCQLAARSQAAADIFTCKQWTLPTSETGFGFLVKFWV
jgi:hypothetical protein